MSLSHHDSFTIKRKEDTPRKNVGNTASQRREGKKEGEDKGEDGRRGDQLRRDPKERLTPQPPDKKTPHEVTVLPSRLVQPELGSKQINMHLDW